MTEQAIPLKLRSRIPIIDDVLPVVGLFIITLLLWLPFGFAVPFWADGWPMMNIADQGVVVENTVRPLVYIPYAIARVLSPNVFVGVNVMIAGLVFGKALFLYLILKRLIGNKPLSFAAAALVAVFPADTAIFNEGTFSIHFALCSYLIAVYALIVYWQDRRWYFLPLMGLALLFTTGIYETVYPLLLFTPLLLLYDQSKITRRTVRVALLWYVVPLLVIGRLVFLASNNSNALSYQANLFSSININNAITSLLKAYAFHFGDAWEHNWGLIYPNYGIAAGVIMALVIVWLSREQIQTSKIKLLLLALCGLAILFLGYVPYSVTALSNTTDRTFFYSSVGGAITLAALVLFLVDIVPIRKLVYGLYALLIAVIVGRGMVLSLDHHQANYNNAIKEMPVLRALVAQVPALEPNTLVVIIDENDDHTLGNIFVQSSFYFANALQVLYEDSTIIGTICYPLDEDKWGIFNERCSLEPHRVVGADVKRPDSIWTYDQVVALDYHPDGTLTLLSSLTPYVTDATDYDPDLRIDTTRLSTPRITSMLGGN